MLIVISPAKTLDFENARAVKHYTYPEFANQAEELVNILRQFTIVDLKKLMNISDKLASLNSLRLKNWQKKPSQQLAKQAICAFKGEVYTGLNVDNWVLKDFDFAQKHLRILSGLYGTLRPLDNISPYRLEMGTKLETNKGNTLYDYWNDKITLSIQKQLNKQGDEFLVNLASNEYFKSIQEKKIKAKIITPVFKDFKNGEYKVISIYAKKARGLMSRYIIKNCLKDTELLKGFNDGGYAYNDRLSKGNEWVFTRD